MDRDQAAREPEGPPDALRHAPIPVGGPCEGRPLEATGAAASLVAQANVDRADRYTLCVVLFATSLFFAGISTRLGTDRTRLAVLTMGWFMFLGTLAWMLSFPAHLGV